VLHLLRVRNAHAALFALVSVPLAIAACSGAPPPPVEAPPGPPPAPPPTVPPPAAEVEVDAGAVATSDAGPPEPAKPLACPADMVLVDGDYCTDLELTCKPGKSHYAKQNHKTICSEFEQPTKCIGKKEHRRYCVDKYEYPNKKGEKPEVMNNFPQAQHLCAAQSKRVCTETEWTMACEGPEYKPYPYGYSRDPNKCRGDRPYKFPSKMSSGVLLTHSPDKKKAAAELERLWDGVLSGSQPECVSDYGVFDMPGNADELAASETPKPKGKFDNVTTGGPWLDGVRNQCRPKIYDHNEGFSYYYLSFRCCGEADGKPTDPRSPKQIQRGEKWK
jgi:sulfatase modifying factor 1